jgi:curved DNA-binding protein
MYDRRVWNEGLAMSSAAAEDWYETLQISPNADADTVQRVFRLLAQKYHPDNQETGDSARFRRLHEAYLVLSDPERRAQYDVQHDGLRRERWRFAATPAPADNDFEQEQLMRCIALEILYNRRRTQPDKPSISNLDLSQLTGHPREHLEFTIWYLVQRKLVTRDDQSSLTITADGVDYVEQSQGVKTRRRLSAVS